MPNPTKWDAEVQFWIGAVIVTMTSIMQAVILFSNASYTFAAFGAAFFTIYLTAAICYIALPWVEPHLEDLAHVGRTRIALLAFCFWIGAEETWHSSAAYAAPEGLMRIAGTLTGPETAKGIAILITVASVLAIIEFLSHLHRGGVCLMRRNYRHVAKRRHK